MVANGIVTADVVLPGDPNMPGTVSGVVTDVVTAAPLAGVSVRLWTVGTQSYTYVSTDSAGRYRMTGVPAGRYQLQCAKTGRAHHLVVRGHQPCRRPHHRLHRHRHPHRPHHDPRPIHAEPSHPRRDLSGPLPSCQDLPIGGWAGRVRRGRRQGDQMRSTRGLALATALAVLGSAVALLAPAPAQATAGRADALLEGSSGELTTIAFDPDRRQAVTYWGSGSKQVRLADLVTGMSSFPSSSDSGQRRARPSSSGRCTSTRSSSSASNNLGPGSPGNLPQVSVRIPPPPPTPSSPRRHRRADSRRALEHLPGVGQRRAVRAVRHRGPQRRAR